MNVTLLVGRISFKKEVKVFESGSSQILFGVCTSENYKKDEQWVEDATFHTLKAWNKTAEYIDRNVNVGDMVEINGSNKVDEYEKDGEKKSFAYINLNKIKKVPRVKVSAEELEKGKETTQEVLDKTKPQSVGTDPRFAGDDIPF